MANVMSCSQDGVYCCKTKVKYIVYFLAITIFLRVYILANILAMNKGMWHSGSASALHAESPGFDSPHLHGNVRMVTCSIHVGCC